jgi:hypothetical protein
MRLTSSAFADGAMIPRRFTCDGEDLSPPLAWTDVQSCFATIPTRPEAPGTIGPSMTTSQIAQCFPKVLRRAMTVLRKQLTTSAVSAMVRRALHGATGLTTITFDSWRYPSATLAPAKTHCAMRSNARHADTSSRRPRSSVSTSDNKRPLWRTDLRNAAERGRRVPFLTPLFRSQFFPLRRSGLAGKFRRQGLRRLSATTQCSDAAVQRARCIGS